MLVGDVGLSLFSGVKMFLNNIIVIVFNNDDVFM